MKELLRRIENLERNRLPEGYQRDLKNPGLIKLSGQRANEYNYVLSEINKLKEKVKLLESELEILKGKK